ncbi:ribosome maturation factor RimP [Mycolicibacterium fluoranthenivorans]|uniref:Ribosome maturation factor RimP n=1 Tax=Mycolicibacterium fluoranthenivorans TaxID=258505 RepID=A0A7G8PMT2_9MYCO|nr:ribosome maturation factor RimP [Mycobacterium hackensackense]QNJ95648.1 ribosome maturation factor RimP [Mycolicibacterium fluoranthenivorans]
MVGGAVRCAAVRLAKAQPRLAYRLVTDYSVTPSLECVRTTQDEELAVAPDVPLLPTQKQVLELLDGEFARAGYEIEDVVVNSSTRPPRITVIADSDDGLDLEAIAALSRIASPLLDALDSADTAPYVLEITSRGVDRPLTEEKHFRRARTRKVEVVLEDGSVVTGRIGHVGDGAVRLVIADRGKLSVRELKLSEIAKAVVQVEFSPPNQRELDLVEQSGKGGDA